jgi:hypothetical protein
MPDFYKYKWNIFFIENVIDFLNKFVKLEVWGQISGYHSGINTSPFTCPIPAFAYSLLQNWLYSTEVFMKLVSTYLYTFYMMDIYQTIQVS